MVHLPYPRHASLEGCANLGDIDVRRDALKQDVSAFLEHAVGAAAEHQSDDACQEWVCIQPARQVDRQGCSDGCRGPQHVADDVQHGCPHIHVLFAGVQHVEGKDVHHQAEHGNAERWYCLHGLGILQTLYCFPEDEQHQGSQGKTVDESRKHLGAVVSIRERLILAVVCQVRGVPGEAQRRGVEEHVPRVGDEGKRVDEPATHGLDEHETGYERKSPFQRCFGAVMMRVSQSGIPGVVCSADYSGNGLRIVGREGRVGERLHNRGFEMVRLLSMVVLLSAAVHAPATPLDRLQLPAGMQVELVSDAVENARQMALDADRGFLYVGTRRKGVVYRVALDSGEVTVISRGLIMPSGIALDASGRLYIGALNEVRVIAQPHIQSTPTRGDLLTDQLPTERHHGWKYLRFGPDGQLYLSVGAPCNVCLEEDPRFASILRMDPATGGTQVIAHGVRNSVGLAFHPRSGRLWFTDNGRDMLGDDVPHEELNELVTEGSHYGFPFEHAGSLRDPEYGLQAGDRQFEQPKLNIQAHSAALGLDFARPNTLGGRYADALFIAEHGSWNRTSKVGYRVSLVRFTDAGLTYEPFITGWLEGEKNWGRPNDVLAAPDGSLLVSDDQSGAVYRFRAVPAD